MELSSESKSICLCCGFARVLDVSVGSHFVHNFTYYRKQDAMIVEEDHQQQQPDSWAIYELCSMIVHILKSPPLPFTLPTSFLPLGPGMGGRVAVPAAPYPSSSSSSSKTRTQLPTPLESPASFASLFLGISLALMLFGSVSFVIGFVLMPCVFVLVLTFYVANIIYTFTQLGRSLLFWHKGVPA